MRDLGPALGGVQAPHVGSAGLRPPGGGTGAQATRALNPADEQRLATWRATLQQVAGIGAGRSYPLTSARLRVGRATGSDLVIEDGSVSRTHAELRFEDGAWVVEDLRSANGVQVDGKPVQTARLTPGGRLTLGNVQLVFQQPVPEIGVSERIALLGRSELLANLSADAKQAMAADLGVRHFPKETVILRAGAALEAMLFVVAGQVRVVDINEEGGERVVERVGGGGCFGDRLLLAGGTYGHTLVADTDVCVLELPKAKLQALRRTRPDVNETIVLTTREKLRTAQSKVPEGVQRKDEVEHLAVSTAVHIIGDDLKIQQARKKIEGFARAGQHVLIIGGRGVGKKTFARYYHHTGPQPQQPYLEISLADLEPAAIGATIFGVEADPATPQTEGQTGVLETVGEGTLTIAHIELLDIHQQSQLLTYLKRGWFHRQYGREAVQAKTKLVLLATGSESEVMGRLLPELREALGEHKVVLPALTARLKDIPLLAAPLPAGVCQAGRPQGGHPVARGHRPARLLRLAGQRAGARERHAARRHRGERGHHHRRRPHLRGRPGEGGPQAQPAAQREAPGVPPQAEAAHDAHMGQHGVRRVGDGAHALRRDPAGRPPPGRGGHEPRHARHLAGVVHLPAVSGRCWWGGSGVGSARSPVSATSWRASSASTCRCRSSSSAWSSGAWRWPTCWST